jgi:hypothetical protein
MVFQALSHHSVKDGGRWLVKAYDTTRAAKTFGRSHHFAATDDQLVILDFGFSILD